MVFKKHMLKYKQAVEMCYPRERAGGEEASLDAG